MQLPDSGIDRLVLQRLRAPFGCEFIEPSVGGRNGRWRIHDTNDDAIATVSHFEEGYARLIVLALNEHFEPKGWVSNETRHALKEVYRERPRQEDLRRAGKFKATCATRGEHELSHSGRLPVLAEEFGEVAKIIVEAIIDPARMNWNELRKDLIQVAAVAVAWTESLTS